MLKRSMIHTAIDLEAPCDVPYDLTLETLKEGELIEEHGLMSWGSNYTFLMTVKHCDTEFLAIYKPRKGERPLWDFPDGTLCERETASYVISEMLGWRMVPPTVLREGPRGIGSVQVFINHDPNEHYFTFNDSAHETQLMQLALLDAIINNADRKGGHCVLDEDDRVWGIDHGLTFHPMNKLRTVIWDYAGEDLPQHLTNDLAKLCQQLDDSSDVYAQQLEELLSTNELRALKKRINRLLQDNTYPMPGPGPNRPWPSV